MAEALFQTGDFTLASGEKTSWKIDCDALTKEDWEGLAAILAERVGHFSEVIGVPRGGLPLAEALQKHVTPGAVRILFVDDVWTTGGTINRFIEESPTDHSYVRAVVFARSQPPRGVVSLFVMPKVARTYLGPDRGEDGYCNRCGEKCRKDVCNCLASCREA